MSQESNTESNSDDKPKKRLSLKKSSGGTPSPAPAGGTPSAPAPASEPIEPQKPIRMSFKKKDEAAEAPTKPAPQPSVPVEETPEAPSDPEPELKVISPLSLGLKKEQPTEDIGDEDGYLPPPPVVPPIASGIESDAPPPITPPLVKSIPIFNADEPGEQEKPGLLPPPPLVTGPPLPPVPQPLSGGPKPPPGMKIRRDDDDIPSGLLPPPMPGMGIPPPLPEVDDLMDEVVEADKKKSGSSNSLKGVLVAFVILVILVGGIGFFGWGVYGMLNKDEEVAEELPVPPSVPASTGPTLATDEPKSFLGKTALLTEQVTAKASTEAITDAAEDTSPPPPAPPVEQAPAPAPVSTPPTTSSSDDFVGVKRDVPSPPKATRVTGDPEVRAWIENLSPTGIGRGMMLLNGEKYRVGEVINPQLNIRWVGLDQQLGILVFEDPYGVRYEKDY